MNGVAEGAMMDMCAVDWVLVIQVISAVAAAIAAGAALVAAREARKNTHAQLLMGLMSIVNSEDHKRAMARLLLEREPATAEAVTQNEIGTIQQLAQFPRDTALARSILLADQAYKLHGMGLIDDRIVRSLFMVAEAEAMLAVPEFAQWTPEIHQLFVRLYPEAVQAVAARPNPVPPTPQA